MFKVNEKDLQFIAKKLARRWSIFSGRLSWRVTQWDSIVSIGSISRLISSHDHNWTSQAIAMDWYQSCFRKLDVISGKKQAAVKTDQKVYSLLIYNFFCNLIYDFFLSKDFQSSYITFDIFNNSTFFGTTEKINEK